MPTWSCDGSVLYFISDRDSGWWNLWSYGPDNTGKLELKRVLEAPECEFAGPQWQFGNQSFVPLQSGWLLATYSSINEAGSQLVVFDPLDPDLLKEGRRACSPVGSSFTDLGGKLSVQEDEKSGTVRVAMVAASPTQAAAVVVADLSFNHLTGEPREDTALPTWRVLKKSLSSLPLPLACISRPEVIAFPTAGNRTAYALYYSPRSNRYQGKEDELPPLLVKIHGGPTAACGTAFNPNIQYWTSRGIAVCDVNYGGSTGFGREYRDRLKGQWGVVDVDDCCNAALFLTKQGKVDEKRLCIDGRSAGGFTTLACLAFKDIFAVGASLFGVADLEALAEDTHKFESRYLDGLLGPFPAAKDIYMARSPIRSVQNITSPLILFQGDEDKIVPPNQAKMMFEACKANGVPTALVMFQGEQHGFKIAANIRTALDGQLFFFSQVLKPSFQPDIPPETATKIDIVYPNKQTDDE